MTEYRYLAHDLRTGEKLAELPLSAVRYGRRLNGAGVLSGSLTLGQRTTGGTSLDSILLAACEPTRTALYVVRDDVIVWGGIIWEHGDYDSSNRSLQIQAAEFWSYFKRRRLRAELDAFPALDQFEIVRTLLGWAQGQIGGDIGVFLGSGDSGVTRDPIYYAWERRNIGQIVEELAGADDGFDFAIEVVGTPGEPQLALTLANVRGRTAAESGLVFEPGKNLGGYRWPRSGAASANAIDIIGAGEGETMVIGAAVRSDLIAAGYPLLDDVVAYKLIDDEALATAKARALVESRAEPITTATLINVLPGGDPPLGSWIMGDYARFRVEDDERFPAQSDGSPGLDRFVRIIADDVAVSDAGVETVNLSVEVK